MSSPCKNASRRGTVHAVLALSLVTLPLLGAAHDTDPASLHMLMTPVRAGTPADSTRAAAVIHTLRAAIGKYRDTTAAVADGYKMFAPQIKQQKVYHFSNGWLGLKEQFRFDPARPTSLLYKKGRDGNFQLIGAMYVAPRRFGPDELDARIPLGVARWHKHINWCMPPRGKAERWLERENGLPVFGPESPIATKVECDAVRGVFRETILGWMVHANVFAGDDPKTIWGDDHAGHDMHEGMKHDEM
ncbi:MAG: hypothetical protein ABIP93_10185 [Gemmatimonadaceae bacterium]